MSGLFKHRRTYWLVVPGTDGNFRHRRIRTSDDSRIPRCVPLDGVDRAFRPEKAYWFIGWNPFITQGFWTPLRDFIEGILIGRQAIKRFILFYEPGEPEPMDLLQGIKTETKVNPRIHRALTVSKLYDNYLKGLKYQSSVNMTTVILALVLGGILLLVLYGMGYFT